MEDKKSNFSFDSISEKAKTPMREVWKPDLSELPDAIVDGKFLLKHGQDLLIEYPEPWRETVLWKVIFVYTEDLPTEVVPVEMVVNGELVVRKTLYVRGTTVIPGHVRLLDLHKNQHGATNYLTAKDHGLVLKIWTGKVPNQK